MKNGKMKRLAPLAAIAAVLVVFFQLQGNDAHAKALVVGEAAPNFTLGDSLNEEHSLEQYKGKTVVLEWTNPECPFVRKHYDTKNMQGLQKKYTDQGVVWLTIFSSAEGKQGHRTPQAAAQWKVLEGAHPTAALLDPSGAVGGLYGAKTTPHMYIVDGSGTLVYMGAIDSIPSAKKTDVPEAVNYVARALDSMAAGTPIETAITSPYGCSVKY